MTAPTVRESVMSSEPLVASPLIDVHGHFGTFRDTFVPHALDEPRLIAEMDRWGCRSVWMSGANPGYGGGMSEINDLVFGFASRYPGRILPYCTLSSLEPGRAVDELRRCLSMGPCAGVKMHRYTQPKYLLSADWLQPVLEVLSEEGLVYMNHDLFAGNVEDSSQVFDRHHDLTFMNGHFVDVALSQARRHPNLVVSTCAEQFPERIAGAVRSGLTSQLLLGSDFGLFCFAFGAAVVAFADVPEDDKRSILGVNALRLLERMKWNRA